ncbi:MAG: helix-turn-helix transcriptional regulator [Clostridia bacterium]|nr:helix-turn-helix transcriptional regulator [Clostridia bacterium]
MEIKFKENLRSLRISKKMSQKDLANLLNVDQRTVSAWEKGVCEPSFSMLYKICKVFDEDFNDILS